MKTFSLVVFLGLVFAVSASAQTISRQGMEEPYSLDPNKKWEPAEVQKAQAINALEPYKVRIGLKLTMFRKMVEPSSEGKSNVRFVPEKEMMHTLRARLDKVNHFFIDNFHIEAKPIEWIRKSRRYRTRLTFYKRFGAFGQLEENIGHIELSGILADETNRVFVLYGSTMHRFRDKFGSPVLDVAAGYRPAPSQKAVVTQAPKPRPKVRRDTTNRGKRPGNSSKPVIRGRF